MAETAAPNTYQVERSTVIGAPAEKVYEALVDFHRWIDWSPWEGLDPSMSRTYSGPEQGVGAVYEWEGNRKVGKGRMEILDAEAPASVGIDLDFIKPFKSHNTTRFTLTPDGASTTVTWTMIGPKTLMTKIMGIFKSMDDFIGKDFEKGLARLKSTVEV
jgi:uncharacterized protein YndB with AHSA1/START domain